MLANNIRNDPPITNSSLKIYRRKLMIKSDCCNFSLNIYLLFLYFDLRKI